MVVPHPRFLPFPSFLLRRSVQVVAWSVLGLTIAIAATQFVVRAVRKEPKPFQGYTLVAPLLSTKTYLIDMEGRPVRTWSSDYTAGQVAYLLDNGHLLRAAQITPDERLFSFPQAGGRVQEFTWNGELVWDFKFHTEKQIPHHDIARLPNGNVLLIVWEMKTVSETVAAGRSLDRIEGPWLVDSLIEIKPTGKTTGEVVWEWHVWDHLIVGHDTAGRNRKDVAAHPELIDINFGQTLAAEVARAEKSAAAEARRRDHLNTLQSIGYLGAPAAHGNPAILPDWTHINAISFNPELDQIMLTVRAFSEIWIIDHSTTTAEAKGHTGGRAGMGGDLLYRWGNPQAYRAGKKADRQLFAPHGRTGFLPAARAPAMPWFSITAWAARKVIFRRSTKSSFPSTPPVATHVRPRRPLARIGPSGATRPPTRRAFLPGCFRAPSGCPTATRSSVTAKPARSSRWLLTKRSSGSTCPRNCCASDERVCRRRGPERRSKDRRIKS